MMPWYKESQARCGAATAGPWTLKSVLCGYERPGEAPVGFWLEVTGGQRALGTHMTLQRTEAEFIAHARTDLPRALALLAEAEILVQHLYCTTESGPPGSWQDRARAFLAALRTEEEKT